jgi:hypothetical protein
MQRSAIPPNIPLAILPEKLSNFPKELRFRQAEDSAGQEEGPALFIPAKNC